jgi:outer membrane protein assembly factor BamE
MLLAGCASKNNPLTNLRENPPNWLTPFRIDIGQGNYITESMVGQLKKGMSREQVRGTLGTPLLIDPFRNDRWDYVFKLKRGDGRQDRRRFFVQFRDDALESWGGDSLPREGGEELLPSRPAR